MPKRSHFFLREKRDRERESERGKKRNLSPAISRGFANRNSAGRELKLLYATRATYGYHNHMISPRSKVRVFMETEKKAVSWEIMLIEVGFYPTQFNFYLRACVCVCVKVENVVHIFFL